MQRAAADYAAGRSVVDAPPSLRLYALAKQLPGLWSGTDLLDAHHCLFAEVTLYAAEEARAKAEAEKREGSRRGGLLSRRKRRGR